MQKYLNLPKSEIHHFFYPVTHDEAVSWFHDFLERFVYFGTYQDAIQEHSILFHALHDPQ